jgi:hypothetical protein
VEKEYGSVGSTKQSLFSDGRRRKLSKCESAPVDRKDETYEYGDEEEREEMTAVLDWSRS